MPRVPTPDFTPVHADTSVLTPARADTGAISTELAAAPGRQLQQAGNAVQGIGNAALGIATRMQEDVNQVRVGDALNRVRQKALDLAYDPQAGFLGQKGNAALERPHGGTLADEYGEKLQQSISELAGNLGNDAQRQAFAVRAGDVTASFNADIQRHTLQEYKHFSLSVQDGAIKLATDEAKRNWADPVKVDTALSDIKTAVVRAGQLQGEAANETLAKLKIATSHAHTGILGAALQEGNPTYANLYLQKHKDEMTADDILKVNGAITKEFNGRVAQEAVRITSQALTPRFQPNDMDRLQGIVLGLESGGKGDANPDGSPLLSVKGAKYAMQVMPATAKAPGFGITPARDDSPGEYNRVGREYLGKLVEKYGNVPYALAAYNAGPGAVDEALKKAARSQTLNEKDPTVPRLDWQAFLPKETQDYVQKGMAKFASGGGAGAPPSELEYVQHAIGLLGPNARPEAVQLTRAAAEHDYALVAKAVKQREEAAVATAQRGIIENGGRYTDLPLAVRMAVPPKEIDNLIGFAQKISKGDDTTSPWLYHKLTSRPEALASMSDDAFFALRRELSEADFKHFSNERAKLTGGAPGASGPGDLNTPAIKQALDVRLRTLQIDPSPKDDGSEAARIGGIRRFVDQYFLTAQREAGKKFTDADVSQHLDALFAKNVTLRGWLSSSSGPMLGMKASDVDGATRDNIRAAFKRQGVDTPTDAQILNAYWNMKVARK